MGKQQIRSLSSSHTNKLSQNWHHQGYSSYLGTKTLHKAASCALGFRVCFCSLLQPAQLTSQMEWLGAVSGQVSSSAPSCCFSCLAEGGKHWKPCLPEAPWKKFLLVHEVKELHILGLFLAQEGQWLARSQVNIASKTGNRLIPVLLNWHFHRKAVRLEDFSS